MHDLIGTCAYLKYACIQDSHYPLVASGVLDNTVEAIGLLSERLTNHGNNTSGCEHTVEGDIK